MLEKLPSGLGRALEGVRPGLEKLVVNDVATVGTVEGIRVSSAEFEAGSPIPSRYTADGEGESPPLDWAGIPPAAAALALLIEDADSPTPYPLVHAIVWDLPPHDGRLPEGALPSHQDDEAADDDTGHDDSRPSMGRNSYLSATYLPPDPPPGHGTHRYAFQLFALDLAPRFDGNPGRREVLDALRGHVMAKGCLIGTYERQ